MPPKSKIIQIVDVQPCTASPKNKRFNIIKIMKIKDTIEKIIPNNVEIDNGTVENATIPSIEYLNKDQRDQWESHSTVSMFSYSSHFVLYPTQLKMPFENLLYSFSSNIESTT